MMDKKDKKKYKLCPYGHAIGRIAREEVWNQGKRRYVTRLRLFRHAVDLATSTPQDSDEFATVEGTAPEIGCDICQSTGAKWFPGEEALAHLLGRVLVNRLSADEFKVV